MLSTLNDFNRTLKQATSRQDRLRFMRESILHGTPYVFQNRESEYFQFRTVVSNEFNIGFHEVFIVGSAKLGYSYHKGTMFSLNSDIDVVLVSPEKFESILKLIREYDYQLVQGKIVLGQEAMEKYALFLRYLTRGWMRPDMLPFGLQGGQLQDDWFDFFRSISHGKSVVGDYAVNAGLFKNYEYLERYYLESIEKHYDTLRI